MPSRNVQKHYYPDNYYHVYNRGVNRQPIFHDADDYAVFLNLIKRYLGGEPYKDKYGRNFPWLAKELDLVAYCLMPNHYHLCFYLKNNSAIEVLMRGLGSAYTRYFNVKYNRVGSLFQGVYKASQISSDSYLMHITRYIHLNPKDYLRYEYSSLPYYLGQKQGDWLKPKAILAMFDNSPVEYKKFLADYEEQKQIWDELKYELANGAE